MPRKPRQTAPKQTSGFDLRSHLSATDPAPRSVHYRSDQVIFSQGDRAGHVKYIESGSVKLSVVSQTGKEAIVAILGAGDFFGEGVLADQDTRIETATAIAPTTVLAIEKSRMLALLHNQPGFSEGFIAHMLSRNLRIEAALVDQLFNSSEKRLARTLLLMARYGPSGEDATLPHVNQETLAAMVGTTRSRVNLFMNKFRKLGLIEYNGTLKVNRSLLTVVLHD